MYTKITPAIQTDDDRQTHTHTHTHAFYDSSIWNIICCWCFKSFASQEMKGAKLTSLSQFMPLVHICMLVLKVLFVCVKLQWGIDGELDCSYVTFSFIKCFPHICHYRCSPRLHLQTTLPRKRQTPPNHSSETLPDIRMLLATLWSACGQKDNSVGECWKIMKLWGNLESLSHSLCKDHVDKSVMRVYNA